MCAFNIAEIAVTHTYYYQPDEYLAYCDQHNLQPTEAGFYNFILPEINEDFPGNDYHPHTVTYTES